MATAPTFSIKKTAPSTKPFARAPPKENETEPAGDKEESHQTGPK